MTSLTVVLACILAISSTVVSSVQPEMRAVAKILPNKWRRILTTLGLLTTFGLVVTIFVRQQHLSSVSSRQGHVEIHPYLRYETSRPTLNSSEREYECRNKCFNRTTSQRDRIRHICPELNVSQSLASTESSKSEIYVDDNRRYLYCQISKVAGTNWKRVLLTLNGYKPKGKADFLDHWTVHGPDAKKFLKPLSKYTMKERQYRLDNYFKFMFVREPMERLVSAYRFKLLRVPSYGLKTFIPDIIKRYRKTGRSMATGNITFPEFVNYVIDFWKEDRKMDMHWETQYKLCQPCLINYDFIGHFETLHEDGDAVLETLNALSTSPEDVKLTKFPRSDSENDMFEPSRVLLDRYFSQISSADIEQLYKVYELDYRLFGYEHPL